MSNPKISIFSKKSNQDQHWKFSKGMTLCHSAYLVWFIQIQSNSWPAFLPLSISFIPKSDIFINNIHIYNTKYIIQYVIEYIYMYIYVYTVFLIYTIPCIPSYISFGLSLYWDSDQD